MKKKLKLNSISAFFKSIYIKLFKINDTPLKIALGLGLGVSLGIIPGAGPIAALCLAFVFRVNRAAALSGSVLTNTWLSIATFFLSIKLGSAIIGLEQQRVYRDWLWFIKNFRLLDLFKLSIIKIIFPVLIGYFIVALGAGLLVFLVALIITTKIKNEPR